MDLDFLPLWLVQITLLIALPGTLEAGYRLQKQLSRGGDRKEAGPEVWNNVVVASITFLALLLAFGVTMAESRYETRRVLLVDEANAISTSYLRAQLYSDPARARLSGLIGQYAHDREAVFLAGDDRAKIAQAAETSHRQQDTLWQETANALRQPGSDHLATAFLLTMNQMFDLGATREAALDARLPARIILVLLVISFMTALISGYALGTANNTRRLAPALVFVMAALTINLILDLDHPRSGAITIPEGPMLSAIASIDQMERVRLSASTSPKMP